MCGPASDHVKQTHVQLYNRKLNLPMQSSIVINNLAELQRNPPDDLKGLRIGIAHIYCEYGLAPSKENNDLGTTAKQTVKNIMGSLLQQLLLKILPSDIPAMVHDQLMSIHRQLQQVDVAHILEMLKTTLAECYDYVFICLDALDELDQTVCREILVYLKEDFRGAKLFLTGRPPMKSTVNHTLAPETGSSSKLPREITIIADLNDIRAFLEQELEKDNYPEEMNPKLRERILTKLTQGSKGM